MIEEVVIPVSVFITFLVALGLVFRHQYLTRKLYLDVFRKALEDGVNISPELVQSIMRHKDGPWRDTRRGMQLISLAIAISLAGLPFSFPDNNINPYHLALGLAAFPFLLGLTYLIFAILGKSQEN